MDTYRISIPKPCHEDWATMTANEKGRFCDKCIKTVHDFSNKNDTELHEYLSLHPGEKMCGRFRQNQLNRPIAIQLLPPPSLTPFQIFLFCLLLIFGTTLFSCTSPKDEKINSIEAQEIVGMIRADYVDPVVEKESICFVGEPSIEEIEEVVEPPVKGEVMKVDLNNTDLIKPEQDTPYKTIDLKEVEIVEYVIPLIDANVIRCYFNYSIDCYWESPETINTDKVDLIPEDQLLLYPNPTHENFNFRFQSENSKNIKIELYDLNGKLIKILLPQQDAADFEMQFDVSDLPRATYLVRLINGDKIISKRLVLI
jgi:hypothetical protein